MFGQKVKIEKLFEKFEVDYMGGHMMYPKKTGATVGLFSDQLDIGFGLVHSHNIKIPYETMTKIGFEDEARITKTRIFFTPLLVGLLWKKKFRYTVIDYKDEAGIDQAVVIDFHRKAEKAQQMIYEKMIEARHEVWRLQTGGEIM